jgi:acyl carrier protein
VNNYRNGTSLNQAEIAQMIIASLKDVLAMDNGSEVNPETITAETRLIGREAALDSMGLVNLIIEVEQRLEEEYDVAVILADERAMSQKNSPFRSVQSLADYICQSVEM